MLRPFTTLAAVLFLCAPPALAQDMPDLVGTWQGSFRAQLVDGVTTGTFTMMIESQDDELFSGLKSVERTDENAVLISAGGQLVRNSEEAFIGVIAADGTGFHVAEVGDPGWYDGRIIDSDTIEVTYVESGTVPVVHRTTLQRQD